MFTLKFCNVYEDTNTDCTSVISCTHYEKRTHSNGEVSVTVYPTFTNEEGVEYRVGDAEKTPYFVCYVENINGQTIDTIRKRQAKSG